MSLESAADFHCPISLEIMSDPVILSSGHTFDRKSIERWIDAGHRTCPITKLPLPEPPTLIPNHALRSLISNFTLVSFPKPKPTNPHTLIQILSDPSYPLLKKLTTLDELTKISKTESRRLSELGVVSAVSDCVESSELGLQEKGLTLLLNLSLDDDGKVGLVAEGVVEKAVYALRRGLGDSRAISATLLTSLAVLEVNCITIGSFPDAISSLVWLLQVGSVRERKEAAIALFTLCSFNDNRIRAVGSGAVSALVGNAGMGMERAVEVLALLAKCRIGREEILRFDGVLETLIGFTRGGSSRGVQYALMTLSLLCNGSERMLLKAIQLGLFDVCVVLLEDDSEKVRRNAKNLIQILQGKSRNQ